VERADEAVKVVKLIVRVEIGFLPESGGKGV
jgi:hypothetical protein